MNDQINNIDLNIRIDRVVLHGISLTSYQQFRLKESVEAELNGLFSVRGVPSVIPEAPMKIKADAIRLDSQKPAPDQLGKQLANAIFNSITGGDAST
jgi:hypothetical protein